MDSSPIVKLTELITMAGGQSRLAALLGVTFQTVHNWRRAGQISKTGAILVSTSELLSKFFSPFELRPDLHPEEIEQLKDHDWFVTARIEQIEYENNPTYAQNTLYYLQDRLGVLPDDNNTQTGDPNDS